MNWAEEEEVEGERFLYLLLQSVRDSNAYIIIST
jgi:hypothetical protein